MDWKPKMERSKLFEWVKETYGTESDYPWMEVFRMMKLKIFWILVTNLLENKACPGLGEEDA